MNEVKLQNDELEFLIQSNYIEDERGEQALEDAIKAWDYARNNFKDCGTLAHLINIHYILMCNIFNEIAGKIRDVNVTVGGRSCPDYTLVGGLLYEWLKGYGEQHKGKSDKQIDIICRQSHVDFEHIHPFQDGNGRTGRILYNMQRIRYGLDILVIKEEDKVDYYNWF